MDEGSVLEPLPMSDEPRITVEMRGPIFLMGLNRSKKMNAFDSTMLLELSRAFELYEASDELRCAVIFAHGENFTAGLDLAEVAPRMMSGEMDLGAGVDPWGVFGRQRTKPTVIAVHGRCLTLGIELCLAQDVRIAASNTKFAQIEIKRGIFPFGGATFRLPQVAGWGNAMRWLLTGDEFDAAEALRIGLVQQVVEPGRQLAAAIEIAETIAAQAPLGVRATIASARRSLVEADAAKALMPELQKLMATDDAREGMMSFMERRAAKFEGK